MSKDGRIWLSHTGLESLSRCPRCFWLQYNKGVKQPEGIVSRLANRFDYVLKNYFNCYRGSEELPSLVSGKLAGRLQNPFQEAYFYQVNNRYGFYGKLDECLVTTSGELVPVDFKTASTDPRDKEILSAYVSQIDDYLFLLEHNRRTTAGYGYLIFFYPDTSEKLHEQFPIVVDIKKVTGHPDNTAFRLQQALQILDSPLPDPGAECPFCAWYNHVGDIFGTVQTPPEKEVIPGQDFTFPF